VLADRTERGRVYAGVLFDSANGGLFLSEDGGVTWEQSMRGMGVRDVYSLYQPEGMVGTIYAGTNHGLFRSDDHGRNWTPVKKVEEVAPEAEATVPDSSPAPVTPAANSPGPRRVTGQPIVLPTVKKIAQRRAKKSPPRKTSAPARQKKRTSTKARSKPKPKPAPPSDGLVDLQSQVFSLVPLVPKASGDGSEPTLLVAATWDGLFRTADEKKGWKPLKIANAEGSELTTSHINVVATHPRTPGLIWIGTDDGLFISRDDGETFTTLRLDAEERRVKAIAFDPRSPLTAFVGTVKGFYRTTDGGATWERRGGGMPLSVAVSTLAINPLNPDDLYVSDYIYGGFYYSRDRGRTWEPLDISSLPSRRLWALTPDPFDRNRVYIGSFSGGVYVMSRKTEAAR
jgi:hypothetical protein